MSFELLSDLDSPVSSQDSLDDFIVAQRAKTTESKTRIDIKKFKDFLITNNVKEDILVMTAEKLDHQLAKFFKNVRKRDGGEYDPNSISSFQRFLEYNHSTINILKDRAFDKSRRVLAAKRKQLTYLGKGNLPNASR